MIKVLLPEYKNNELVIDRINRLNYGKEYYEFSELRRREEEAGERCNCFTLTTADIYPRSTGTSVLSGGPNGSGEKMSTLFPQGPDMGHTSLDIS